MTFEDKALGVTFAACLGLLVIIVIGVAMVMDAWVTQ